jgi:hypothetical protein
MNDLLQMSWSLERSMWRLMTGLDEGNLRLTACTIGVLGMLV